MLRPEARFLERLAATPRLGRCSVEFTPDQWINGGPLLLEAAREGISLAASRALCQSALRRGIEDLKGAGRSGTFLALLAFATRMSAEVCTCTPLQLTRRREGVIGAADWCPTCHARAAVGRRSE